MTWDRTAPLHQRQASTRQVAEAVDHLGKQLRNAIAAPVHLPPDMAALLGRLDNQDGGKK